MCDIPEKGSLLLKGILSACREPGGQKELQAHTEGSGMHKCCFSLAGRSGNKKENQQNAPMLGFGTKQSRVKIGVVRWAWLCEKKKLKNLKNFIAGFGKSELGSINQENGIISGTLSPRPLAGRRVKKPRKINKMLQCWILAQSRAVFSLLGKNWGDEIGLAV